MGAVWRALDSTLEREAKLLASSIIRTSRRSTACTSPMASVLMKEHDFSALDPAVPAAVRNLLRRCLRREPRSRLQHIGDARVTIEETVGGAMLARARGLSGGRRC